MSREIEDRLRAALSAKAERIGEEDLRPAQLPTEAARGTHAGHRFRRSILWLAPALAAAAVVGIVVGVTVGPSERHSSSSNSAAGAVASSSAPPITTPAPAKSATAPEPSATDAGPLRDAASQPPTVFSLPEASSDLKSLPDAVLGSIAYWPGGNTRGFGAAHPSELNTNGDPSGIVLDITWHDWGSATATGIGQTYLPKPGGGYYSGTVPIELRATNIGRCGSVTGYQQLLYRVPTQPGGQPTGEWQLWANATNLCQSR